MKSAIRTLITLMSVLMVLCIGLAAAETATTPAPTPSEKDLKNLTFLIEGPDESMPMTVKYSDFTGGKFVLENLTPGTYTITEVNAEDLLTGKEYTFDAENSIQKVTIEVEADATASDTLTNVYIRQIEVTPTPDAEATDTPTPSPTPTATPTPTPTPENDRISIPVTKVWKDSKNRDGNRPDRVIVYLMANGSRSAQAVLSEANGWKYEFTDLPKYSGGKEITYTVTEEEVPLYETQINGYTITNVYTPETTSVTVSKVWLDDNNAAGLRPKKIICTLSNGKKVTLNEANGWTATVDNLPVVVNGKTATYTWTEQEIIGYTQVSSVTTGNTTVFTNELTKRDPKRLDETKIPTNRRGDHFLIIEDYGTPLGVDVIINHVGDCFD